MKSEVKLIDLGADVLRLSKNGRLTKINKEENDWSSSNFVDKGEFTLRLDMLVAEASGDVYTVPAKSASVTLDFSKAKEIAEFISPSAGTTVGRYSIEIVEAYRGPDDALRLLEQLMKQASATAAKEITVDYGDLYIIKQALEEESIRE